MDKLIYLVSGDWYDPEDHVHWTVAAFSSLEAAEQHRRKCQEWIDQYCEEFWHAFAQKFGEPRKREHYAIFHSTSLVEGDRKQQFAEHWFGHEYVTDIFGHENVLDINSGESKMRHHSPDALVQVQAGNPCRYTVETVAVDPEEKIVACPCGPRLRWQEFEQHYCYGNALAIEQYREQFVTLRCCCPDLDCPGWAAVPRDPEAVARHQHLYGIGEGESHE